jgi:hypothetical protein
MDRRAKQLEKKRKSRELTKRKAKALAAKRPSPLELLVRSASRTELARCFVSAGWSELEMPALVQLLVTRPLPSGDVAAATVLVDRTCLGVKDAHVFGSMDLRVVDELVEGLAEVHGGMEECEPLFAQSIVFHALDYARSLGFSPHEDFVEELFGPRPETLVDTPWSRPSRPIYVPGPRDDTRRILTRLTKAVGVDGFEYYDPRELDEDEDGDDLHDDDGEREIVHSALSQSVSRAGITLHIRIYRAVSQTRWILEVEDHLGGSTVWDEPFSTEQAALDAALQAIDEEGVQGLVVAPERA